MVYNMDFYIKNKCCLSKAYHFISPYIPLNTCKIKSRYEKRQTGIALTDLTYETDMQPG